MQPMFFHTAAEPLFGIYAPPRAVAACDQAVLICPPVGHEALRTHWALRQLADRLTQAGLHVFRFDYFGTGDSWGKFEEVSLARWKDDVQCAMDELADNSATRRLSIIGLRLGAALAFETARTMAVGHLVLWDPVVRGAAYLDELRSLQRQRTHGVPNRSSRSGEELLGFRYGDGLIRQIEAIDLIGPPPPRADRIHIVASAGRPLDRELHDRLVADGARAELTVCDDAGDWDALELFAEAVLLGPLQRTLVNCLTEEA